MFEVKKYSNNLKKEWDSFLTESKNQSFLFYRDFIEYHGDRFNDFSLLVFDGKKIVCLFPANLDGNEIISHAGISYGGLILLPQIKLLEVVTIVQSILTFLNSLKISSVKLKLLPRIYQAGFSDEIEWILFKLNAKLYRRDTGLVIDRRNPPLSYQERRKRAIKKAQKLNVEIKSGFEQISHFWNSILIPNLELKHGVSPVHNISEIEYLASSFPNNIIQYNIYLEGEIVAGCTLFISKQVVHAQYISGSQIGRDTGCLDYLFDFLITKCYPDIPFFDFGICNESAGQKINRGLLDWKEGFGGRAVVHDFFQIETSNFILLTNFES